MNNWLGRFLPVALVIILASGCATNPVTGKKELNLVSTDQEISIGKKNYGPYRQAQGGDYVADPEVQRYVDQVGQRLAKVSDRDLPYEFRVINDSTPNAWALPGGKIAMNRGLLVEMQSEAELAAVLGHEIVHAAARHGAQGIQRGLLLQGALIASSIALADSDYRGAALAGAQLGTGLINNKYGRDAEREADYYGMQYMSKAGYDPRQAVELQQTFVRLAEGRKAGWLEGLFASHPPSQERVENNQRTVTELNNPGGDVGRERYKKVMARLVRSKPAYDAYDEAVKARREEDNTKALKLLNKAIRIEPKEALFPGLRGEIYAEKGKKKQAKQDFDHAVALNPGYFKPYLARGFVLRSLGQTGAAQRDFKRSMELLPTTEAKYGLGRIAMEQGRKQEAIGYFRSAAATDSDVGKVAGRYLARLDLADNPTRYVKAGLSLGKDGYLRVIVHNQAPVSISGVTLLLGKQSGAGVRKLGTHRMREVLKPNQRVAIRTRIGPFNTKQASKLVVQIAGAQVAR